MYQGDRDLDDKESFGPTLTGTGSYYNQAGLNTLSSDTTEKVLANTKLTNGTMIRMVGTGSLGEYKVCRYNPGGDEGTQFIMRLLMIQLQAHSNLKSQQDAKGFLT